MIQVIQTLVSCYGHKRHLDFRLSVKASSFKAINLDHETSSNYTTSYETGHSSLFFHVFYTPWPFPSVTFQAFHLSSLDQPSVRLSLSIKNYLWLNIFGSTMANDRILHSTGRDPSEPCCRLPPQDRQAQCDLCSLFELRVVRVEPTAWLTEANRRAFRLFQKMERPEINFALDT